VISWVRANDTMGNMPETAIDDPWQARMDRMRRLLPMPLLAVSTVLALVEADTKHTWARFELGLPVVAAAVVWWAAVTVRVRSDASTGWRLTAFAVHTALAGVPGLGLPLLRGIRLYRVPAHVRAR
jgi:hypothetical protein